MNAALALSTIWLASSPHSHKIWRSFKASSKSTCECCYCLERYQMQPTRVQGKAENQLLFKFETREEKTNQHTHHLTSPSSDMWMWVCSVLFVNQMRSFWLPSAFFCCHHQWWWKRKSFFELLFLFLSKSYSYWFFHFSPLLSTLHNGLTNAWDYIMTLH